MNIYEKLQKCRTDLQNTALKKSGENRFAGYNYFELADFLPKVNELFLENGLCGIVKYGMEMATLDIVNSEKPEETIQFTSPMSKAALKGCHEVQNLGAVETYLRRYLYITALEITESDALDPLVGKEAPEKKKEKEYPKLPDRPKEPDEIDFKPGLPTTMPHRSDEDGLSDNAFKQEVARKQKRSEFRAMLKYLAGDDKKTGEENLFRYTSQTSIALVSDETIAEVFDRVKKEYEAAQTAGERE